MMHETFKIIAPYLASQDIVLEVDRVSMFVGHPGSVALTSVAYTITDGLKTAAGSLHLNEENNDLIAPGTKKFNLHDQNSLPALVSYLFWWHFLSRHF